MSPAQGPRRPRQTKTVFTTKSGKSLQMNRSFSERRKAKKDARVRKRAAYLSTLPKNRWKRLAYRMHPKRVAKYWFSREGAIMVLKIAGIGMIVGFLLLVGLFAYFRKDLPDIKDVSGNNQPGSISYYDRTGKTLLFQDYDAQKRIPVKGEEISKYMKQATIAIEDKDFYHEGAFNVRGIARAAFHNAFSGGGGVQGGSTITQQLVKLNEGWTADRSVTRKVKEVILAVELEREYSKDDILTGYLNVAPYGNIENGVEAAANDYFHIPASKLSLAQSAMLASIPQDPPYYSPYSSPKYNPAASVDYFGPEDLISRQRYVLDQMVKQGMVSQDEADAAKKVNVLAQVHKLEKKYQNIKAPYFVIAAKQELEQRFGSETVQRGGWKVTTTLNLGLQRLADKEVQDNLPNVIANGGDQEAMAAEDVKTGQMMALVGGVDYENKDVGKINYAQTNIPPGSSFKPYDYAALINYSKDVGAGSVLYDTQGPVVDNETKAGYYCTNKNFPEDGGNCIYDYDHKYPGPVTLRYGLAGSRNVPAIKAMIQAGVNKTIDTASSMMMGDAKAKAYQCYSDTQLTKPTQCYPSSAIGDGAYLHIDEHVNGLATLARLGNYIPRTYILQINDASGKPFYKWTQPKPKQVITPDAAYIVNDMLSDPNASYLPYSYKFQNYNGWKFAVKTGTTNDNFDGLMTSWSTQYAVVSWVGYHTRQKALTAGSMEFVTEPLTRGWMEGAHNMLHKSPVNWEKPSGVKTAPAFVVRNHVGVGSVEPSPSNDLYPSWYQPKTGNTSYTVDKVSKKRATNCTPALAKLFVGNANASSFSVDQFVDGNGGGTGTYDTSASDDVHQCSDKKPVISLVVARQNEGGSNDYTVTITASQGTHALSSKDFRGTIKLTVNGKVVKAFNMSSASPQSFSYNFSPKNGSNTVTAEATDSVLYQGSDSQTITVNKNDNNGGGNDNFPFP